MKHATETASHHNEVYFTRRELAARQKVSIETLKRWEKAGLLPFYKLGKEVRYHRDDVLRIEKSARVGA